MHALQVRHDVLALPLCAAYGTGCALQHLTPLALECLISRQLIHSICLLPVLVTKIHSLSTMVQVQCRQTP